MINVHHLELFYYVAKYEGITAAVRKMPYGIQQPAVSGQLLQLEKSLEVILFHRRPFALTPAGDELYNFVYPFFSRLPEITEKLTGEDQRHLRLAASAVVLTNHLPVILERLRAEEPNMKLTLRDFLATNIEEAILSEEVDLAISAIPSKPAPGIKTDPLLKLPLLLLHRKKDAKSYKQLTTPEEAAGGLIEEPLIALGDHEIITQWFQEGMEEKGLNWPTTIEVNSLDLIQSYAMQGYGYGLTVAVPGIKLDPELTAIKLPGFPSLEIGLLHRGNLKPLLQSFVKHAKNYALELLKA